jgi:antitoxin component YwqK of YwqJK toxin-antitoxin module
MSIKIFFILVCCNSLISPNKTYHKTYYYNGNIKEEGWLKNNVKVDYWKFYYENGTLKKEGHFKNNLPEEYWHFYRKNAQKEKEGHFIKGKKCKWWAFYKHNGQINFKCQMQNNKRNGYSLIYQNKRIVKVEKYKKGMKTQEWNDSKSFKRDNNLEDLK